MTSRVLYITQNGIADHIGRSQIAPYLIGLARSGQKIHILSAEKALNRGLIESYETIFKQADIEWTRVAYRNSLRVVHPILTQLCLFWAAVRIVRRNAIAWVHCRSHPAALIGFLIKFLCRKPYVFDFRDFYVDCGREQFSGIRGLIYLGLARLEEPMLKQATCVVCLTERAKSILESKGVKNLFVIPCCADFEHFDIQRVSQTELIRARQNIDLSEDDFVMLYLGSLGFDYLLTEMLMLFKQLCMIKDDAKLLFVSNNGEQLVRAALPQYDIADSDVRFVMATREQIPAFMAMARLSVVFIRPTLSKAGCSPTKLAELFAANIPVIANAGVGDLDRIIDLDSNGSTLVANFSNHSLKTAILRVLELQSITPVNIRENMREFDLEEGIRRYLRVYRQMDAVSC
ncbi:MAG: glycosyltransferase [Myxococcota bacterium]